MKSAALGLVACLAAGFPGACLADDLKAEQRFGETQVSFDLKGTYSNLTLTVTGPNGLHAVASSKSGSPTIDLKRLSAIDDGIYKYNLTASTGDKVPERSGLDNGRGTRADAMLKSVSASGLFQVKGGMIVKFDPSVREPSRRAN
jgi:hypothetical protein